MHIWRGILSILVFWVASPVPADAVSFVRPTARILSEKADGKHKVKLLILILTDARPETTALRAVLRSTWLSWAGKNKNNVQWRFIIGEGQSAVMQQEMTTYKDVLEFDMPRSCTAPSCQSGRLTRSALLWALQNATLDFDYVLRTETDTFLCLPALYNRLAKRQAGQQHPMPLFLGHYHSEEGVFCRADENFQLASRELVQWFFESHHVHKQDPAFLPNANGDKPLFHYDGSSTFANNFAPFVNTLGAKNLAEVIDDPVALAWLPSNGHFWLDDHIYGIKANEAGCGENMYIHPVKTRELMQQFWENATSKTSNLLASNTLEKMHNLTIAKGHCKNGFIPLDEDNMQIFLHRVGLA